MAKRFLFLLFLFILAGCRPAQSGSFSIYLPAEEISSAEIIKADLKQMALQDQPVLSSADIVSYNRDTHEIELTEEAYRRIQEMFPTPVKTSGIPFVVCAGKDPIYAGAFWTALSSLSFDGVVIMQPFEQESRTLRIELGYPGPDFFNAPDPRSDSRLMEALQAAGKLK